MINRGELKRIMAERELTQTDLAKKAGIARSVVTKILLGTIDPRLSSAAALAQALKLPPEEAVELFLGGDG